MNPDSYIYEDPMFDSMGFGEVISLPPSEIEGSQWNLDMKNAAVPIILVISLFLLFRR